MQTFIYIYIYFFSFNGCQRKEIAKKYQNAYNELYNGLLKVRCY